VSTVFHEEVSDTTNHWRKDLYYTLSGLFTYNGNTYVVTSVQYPTLNVDTGYFGTSFSSEITNISTTCSIGPGGSYARFGCSFHLYSTLGIPIGDLPLGKKYDFGTHSNSFTATP
jgi:hypothetical protein